MLLKQLNAVRGRLLRVRAGASKSMGRFGAFMLLATSLATSLAAHGQTLPALPASPPPIFKLEYDAEGNTTKTVIAPDSRNYATQHHYDSLGRRDRKTDAKLFPTLYGFDLLDQLTSVTDPRQLVTQYQPTGLGNVKVVTSPDAGTANRTFDVAGNLKTRTDARGVLGTYGYDELNRLTQVVYSRSGSTRTVAWTYDQTGSAFGYGVGQLTTATAPGSVATTFRYDEQGNVLGTVQTVAGTSYQVGYSYDAAGHVTSVTYPSGRIVTTSWSNGLPTAITITSAGNVATLLDQIVVSPFGPVQSWVWQLGGTAKPHERIFDTSGRFVRHPLGDLVRDITYDDADRISRYTHYAAATAVAAPAYDQTFGYDELDRLTNANAASTSWSYSYDANGNRTAWSAGSTTRGLNVSSTSNRLDSVTNPARVLGYDVAGNTTTDGSLTFTFNLEGRLSTLDAVSVGANFDYDAMGRRVSRNPWMRINGSLSTGVPTRYVYDQDDNLLGEYTSNANDVVEYVWLGDIPIAVIKQDAAAPGGIRVYAIHADHLNTPRAILDAQGQVRWRWMGEPFGSSPAEEQPTAGLTVLRQNLRFPGQQYEMLGARHYNHFREYDPSTGRYSQSDPLGLEGGINTYGYVGGDPINYFDPNGLQVSKYVRGGGGPGANSTAASPPRRPFDPDFPPAVDPNSNIGTNATTTSSTETKKREKTYQTYTRFNPKTKQCYTGRTSGYGTPEENIKQRGYGQTHLNSEGFNMPVLDRSSKDYAPIRGREQQVIVLNGGAQSEGGTSRNMINGISSFNLAGRYIYLPAAEKEFNGRPLPAGKCECQKQ